MNGSWIIFKRDLTSFFVSPIAYVVTAIFLIITGILFFSNVLWYVEVSFRSMQNPYMVQNLNFANDFIRPLFVNISVILLFLTPALTMRTFSEEKRNGTYELLMTYPVRDAEVVIGKFMASFVFFVLMVILTFSFPAFLYIVGSPELGPILSAYLGFLLLGFVFISFGVFASALTENQIIAALTAFGFNLGLWIIGWLSPSNEGILSQILKYLSVVEHYDPLTKGVLNSSDLIYFLSVCGMCLFLTHRVLMSHKWRR